VPQCQRSKGATGLNVEAASKDGGSVRCSIGSSTTVQHVVTVTNLRRYPATTVVCQGEILSDPRKLKFGVPPALTDGQWAGTKQNLAPRLSYDFDHATILPDGAGSEHVDATVFAYWKRPGRPATVTVTIKVAT
jgi:hypothetical protein